MSRFNAPPIAGDITTRCARLRPPFAAVLMLLLGLVVVASISVLPTAQAMIDAGIAATSRPTSRITDQTLYRILAGQVGSGRDYYVAATESQRQWGYPTRPFFTVRLPTLTWLIAALSPAGARLLLLLVVATTAAAWAVRLISLLPSPPWWIGGTILMGIGSVTATLEPVMWFAETWAGVLIALSLAIRGAHRWWPSILLALVAVLIRELVLPYLVAMGLLAALDGQRREALGWGVAVGVFALVIFFHAEAVQALTLASDRVSPGWNGRGGWSFFIAGCWQMTMLGMFPPLCTALLLPLIYLGLAASRTDIALRTLVTLSGYTLLFALFARQNNVYWMLMMTPILLPGLLFAPFAIADLVRSLRGRAPC